MILPKKKDRWYDLRHSLTIARDVGNAQQRQYADPLASARLQGKIDGLTYVLQMMDELEHE